MKNNHFGIRTLIICILLVTGIIAGAGVVIAKEMSNRNFGDKSHVYPVNMAGQTYGSELYATSIENQPDLIDAIGIDGTEGYVKATDLDESPSTPEEALAVQKKSNGKAKKIPLYAVDGKTIIGEFEISSGETSIYCE